MDVEDALSEIGMPPSGSIPSGSSWSEERMCMHQAYTTGLVVSSAYPLVGAAPLPLEKAVADLEEISGNPTHRHRLL